MYACLFKYIKTPSRELGSSVVVFKMILWRVCMYLYYYICARVNPIYSNSLQVTPIHSNSLKFTPIHSITPIHSNLLQFTPIYSNSLKFTPIYSNLLQFTPIYSNSLQFTPIHADSLHFPPIYSNSIQSTPIHSNPFHFTPIRAHKYIHAVESGSKTLFDGEVGGWGREPFSRNFMKPTPRRKWYLTTGRRFH